MIKLQRIQYSFKGDEISEREVTVEDACHLLHSMDWSERPARMLVCESEEDKKQLIRTYYKMYHNEFNVRHHISDEDQMHLQLAYPAETDVFYVENIYFRFEGGIRELDPRYARVNTHETVFTFKVSPIFECISIHNEHDRQTKAKLEELQRYVIEKHEQLNHLSYEDAQVYLEHVWSEYQEFFRDNSKSPDIERISEVNKNYDLPWYKRL